MDVLTDAERTGLLGHWNDMVTADAGAGHPRPELFDRQAERTPDAVALVTDERPWDPLLTYGELADASQRLARDLTRAGVGPERRVAVVGERSVALLVGLLAVSAAGGVGGPVDAGYPAERIAYVLADADPEVILGTTATRDVVPAEFAGRTVTVDDRRWRTRWLGVPRGGSRTPTGGLPLRADGAAYVIYTSGSTGAPKGVTVSHRGLANLVGENVPAVRHRRGEHVLQLVSPSFDASMAGIWPTLCAGGRLVLAPARPDVPGEELAHLLRTRRVTHAAIPRPSSRRCSPRNCRSCGC
ncbi:Amino acid adenylation domain-containing protein OS=Streptomyces alboniger OX=132473 GN=CP975_32025 PE=4 SV=1 [Streptomyces alboniger]